MIRLEPNSVNGQHTLTVYNAIWGEILSRRFRDLLHKHQMYIVLVWFRMWSKITSRLEPQFALWSRDLTIFRGNSNCDHFRFTTFRGILRSLSQFLLQDHISQYSHRTLTVYWRNAIYGKFFEPRFAICCINTKFLKKLPYSSVSKYTFRRNQRLLLD